MDYQIKVSGIDNNQDKFIWLNVNDTNLVNINSPNIRLNPNKELVNENTINTISENTINTISENTINTISENTINIISENTINENIFNKLQLEMITLIKNKINEKTIIVISGIAGSGKTYTILNIFKDNNINLKNKTICFCGPTNIVVENSKIYKSKLEPYFKKIDYLTTAKLLGSKCKYDNNGNKYFEKNEKYVKMNNYNIVIIDEISMVESEDIEYIKKNNKNTLFIFLGDKNQLNPINSNNISILTNPDISLTENMRCKNIDINKINTFLIHSINQLNTLYLENNKSNIKEYYTEFYRTFIKDFYKLIYTNKNNNIYIVNKFDNFIDLYIELYKKNKSIIGNYTNQTCIQTNNIIKEKILESDKNEANNMVYVDNHFINEQIIFMEHYEQYNTSDFDNIKNIITKNYSFTSIDYVLFIKNITNINISNKIINEKYNKIKDYDSGIVCDTFTENDDILYKYQKLFNYLIKISKTKKYIKNIFDTLNSFENVKINVLTLTNNNINVLNSNYEKKYNNRINNIKNQIIELDKNIVNSSTLKIKKFYNEFIIQTLYSILDKYRINIFAKISCGFSCTIHRLQGCTINSIFVNLEDIFRMHETNNKLKCLYTAISRCSENLIIYLPNRPLCKCGYYTKEIFEKDKYITSYMCGKCGFMEDKDINNKNCSKCLNCSKVYYKHMLNKNICYLCN